MAVLHWVLLPHAREWLPAIERHASQSLGVPVRIGDLQLRGGGWVPAVELRDVVLLDAQQRQALRLPRVSAAVSARSLLSLQLRLEQLLIEDAQLELRRDAQGRLFVAGLALSAQPDPGEGSALADWFLAQPELAVRNARVRWTDELRGAAPLELTQVQLLLRNSLRRHDLRLDATPPAEWGQRWLLQGRFTQPLLARRSDFKRWSGTLHADLPDADLAPLQSHVALPGALEAGRGALRAWVEIKAGEAHEATLDLALQQLRLHLPGREPLALAQVQGRFTVQRDDRALTLATQRLAFATEDGASWPASDARLRLGRTPAGGGEFSASRLDLRLLALLADRLPLPERLQAQLQSFAPEGTLTGLEARWDGDVTAPLRYRAKGRAEDLSVAAARAEDGHAIGRPGVQGLAADFEASEAGGSARIAITRGALEFPGLFSNPRVALDHFNAQLGWRRQTPAAPTAPKLEVQLRDARLANADAQADFAATWRTDAQGTLPGTLELDGRLQQGRATAVARYLPLSLDAHTRQWVEGAVRDGRIAQAAFRVRGDLHDFPFSRPGSGEFRIAGQVDGVTLAYVPEDAAWPPFTQAAGELVFDRLSMQLRDVRARVQGLNVELSRVNGGIEDLHHAQLRIDGQARGPLHDLLRYVNATPVGQWIGGGLAQAGGTGAAELRLALQMPLADVARTAVQGSVLLAGNDVRMGPDVPLLAGARARVDFTQQRVAVVGASARVAGGDAQFEGGTQPDGSLRFQGSGTATAEGLRRAPELGAVARLAGAFSGQAAYRLQVDVRHGRPEFQLTSNLVGLASTLPAPLTKTAAEALPLRVGTHLELANGQPALEHWQVEAGTLLQAQLVRDLQHPDREGAPTLLRGGVGVQQPAPQPAQGLAMAVALPTLDLDAWEQAWDRLQSGSGGDATAGGLPQLPLTLALQVGRLEVLGRRLDGVVAGVSRGMGDPTWRANLEAEQLSGHLALRPGAGAQPGQVVARLARLTLPPAAAQGVESLLAQPPASVPALDIQVEDFELQGKRLGRLEIEAVNRSAGPRQRASWQLDRFVLAAPEAELRAIGQWRPGTQGQTTLDFRLDLRDSGALLQRLGYGGVLRGGKGTLQGEVSWPGSPLSPDTLRMDGRVRLEMQQGRFLKADAGAGRLLSVLSLQSLPRRLTLDFRDVFLQGFAFDSVAGDVHIDDGVASTNNLRMRGLQAAVMMEGKADLKRETQDLHVLVVPEINAGTASLAYAAINPAVGLGTFLAQMFLRRPLMAAGTREFEITGSWSDPQVARVQRAPGAPLPDLDPSSAPVPAAAASAPRTQN